MRDNLSRLTSVSDRIGIPQEILTGLPIIELRGDSAIQIEQQHGITFFSEKAVSVRVSIGSVLVRGSGLNIRSMTRRKILICGRMEEIRIERGAK